MAVKLKVDLDATHRAGGTYDFAPTMERRLIASGLGEAETLDEARARVGMEPLGEAVGDEAVIDEDAALPVPVAARGRRRKDPVS